MLLKDKLAVITGCNRGIGRAILLRFAEEGAEIFACLRKPSDAFASLVDQLAAEKGVRITPFYFDFRNSEEIKAASRDIIAHKRKIDVLVNNAGIASGAFFHMTAMADMRELFEVNFFGPLQFTQTLSRYMVRHRGGSIVNMASTAGLLADAGMTSYGASGPGGQIYDKFGFNVKNLSERAREVIAFYQGSAVRSLVNYPRFKSSGGH